MLSYYDGNIRKLFNPSGGDYKALNLKENLANMTDSEAVDLLSKNGNLVKRPFVIGKGISVAGFNSQLFAGLF